MIGCRAIKILYRSGLPFLLVTFVLKLFLYESGAIMKVDSGCSHSRVDIK